MDNAETTRTAELNLVHRVDQALLDALPGLVLRVSRDGSVLHHKPARPGGLSSLPILLTGKSIPETFPAELSARIMRHVRAAADTDRLRIFELRMAALDGEARDFEARAVPWGVDDALVIVRETSDQKQAERALEASERQYRRLLDLAQEGIWVIDQEARTTYANQSMARMLGHTPAEMQGKHLFSFMDERGKQLATRQLERRQRGIVEQHGFELLRKDGTRLYALIETAPITDDDGAYAGAIAGVLDITERRRLEEALRGTQERYDLAVQGFSAGIWDWMDMDEDRQYWSPKLHALLGYEVGEIEPSFSLFEELLHPDDRAPMRAAAEAHFRDNKPFTMEYRLRAKDGTHKWFLGSGQARFDEQGRPRRMVGTIIDIDARKRAEAALRASEAKFRSVFEASPMGIFLCELQDGERLVFVDANPGADAILGVACAQFVGKTIEEAFPPLADTEVPARLRRAAAHGEIWQTEELVYQDEQIAGTYAVSAFQTAPGKVAALFLDVTEQSQARETIERSETQYRLLVETAPHGIQENDLEGRITLSNAAHAAMYGYPEGGLVGKHIWDLMPTQEERDALRAYLAKLVAEQPPPTPYLAQGRTQDGGIVDVQVDWTYKRDARDRLVGFVSVITDISERKRAERERERLIEELESQNAELERFAYTVSHDLKSPLVTIKGFIGLLERDISPDQSDRLQRDMTHIRQAADKMQRLLNEVLELSRVGRQANPSEAVSLTELAGEAASLVSGQVKEHRVVVEIAPEMPVVVGDRVRLLEVFQNLLDNAVKFMGGQADPRVEIGATEEETVVLCHVRDNGMGIEPRYHDQVFGLFDRLDPNSDGTGVGLALVKRIVEVHGGRVWLDSEGAGKGSTFYFTLPRTGTSG